MEAAHYRGGNKVCLHCRTKTYRIRMSQSKLYIYINAGRAHSRNKNRNKSETWNPVKIAFTQRCSLYLSSLGVFLQSILWVIWNISFIYSFVRLCSGKNSFEVQPITISKHARDWHCCSAPDFCKMRKYKDSPDFRRQFPTQSWRKIIHDCMDQEREP